MSCFFIPGPGVFFALRMNIQHLIIIMEPLKLHAPWEEVKEKLKEADVELTDQDLEYNPGNEDELLSRLENKLGKSKDAIRSWIESISSNTGLAG